MNLERTYETYIACLNARDLSRLGEYVGDDVIYNGTEIGLHGYREMLAGNYRDIPDLRFVIDLLLCDSLRVTNFLPCFARQQFGLADQITVQRSRELHGNLEQLDALTRRPLVPLTVKQRKELAGLAVVSGQR